MKNECHCLYCPNHPLHAKRGKIASPTGFETGMFLGSSKAGRVVDCLQPESRAFSEFDIDPMFEVFPTTAYGDGSSVTGFSRDGITLSATCAAEEYIPSPSPRGEHAR